MCLILLAACCQFFIAIKAFITIIIISYVSYLTSHLLLVGNLQAAFKQLGSIIGIFGKT